MIYETSPSLRAEKTEKTEPGSQTEAKHEKVRKSGGKARSRDSETSERARYATSSSAQLMSELLNQKSSVQGKVPSGYLNAIFDLTGAWLTDASDAKYLAFDGMAVGGQDLLCVKQKPSSTIPPAELKGYLEDLGDCLFSDGTSPSLLEKKTRDGKQKVPEVFKRMLQSHTMQFTSITETSGKEGLTIIWSKRGGDVFSQSHSKWLQTVTANPEAILFKFVPITSLLIGVPGSGYLSHAINLYLRCKYFPSNIISLLQRICSTSWSSKFLGNGHLCSVSFLLGIKEERRLALDCNSNLWGPKFISAPPRFYLVSFLGHLLTHTHTHILVLWMQVSTSQKPVIGLRLYLEGKKSNHLAIPFQVFAFHI
ncbi:hypothetical protein HYC85_003296 [Camellia sinensis]|uniref:MACPF domain-containing protein n=1 Tax=Camellia sinensis TaxID=4442 RepID=A0A7J7IBY7_CAMSI|nr:hypothetical protein HYC85_003296 [Camellia sinensis]